MLHDITRSPLGPHFVQFYKDDATLVDEVADFVDGALRAGDAGLVIATPEHRAAIEHRLQGMRLAVASPRWYPGEYVALDAQETLDALLVEGWPHDERFFTVVGAAIDRATQGGKRRVHAFGEMVALLCAKRNHAAAIRLEELWGELAKRQPVTLFCAYPINLFGSPGDSAAFEQVCARHSHVLPSQARLSQVSLANHEHTVAELEQKAAALEAEVDRRLEAERTLRRREKELADFLENAAEGLNRIGADGVVRWANRAELEMLGLGFDEYVGRPAAHFHADAAEGDAFVARLRAGQPVVNQAATLRAKDGELRHVLIHATPVFENGQLQYTRCFTRDVTEETRAREARKVAHEERTRLLERVEQASRAKDEFLAMLGHELRNPLAPIVTALQLMKMRADTSTANEQAIIARQVDHLVRLVDDLLDISKVTRGKIKLRKEWSDIGEVLAKAVEMAEVLIEQRRHRLTVNVTPEGLRWYGDPMRLAQVVANLLTNAARYTPSGGDLRLAAWREDAQIVISVQDNGVGIEPKMLSRVFDLFVQGKRGMDRAEGGLGIGLALVKSLVAMHGGSVSARSEGSGRGSEFLVRLPLGDAPPGERALPPAARVSGAARGQRVMVVDDNADAAEMLAVTLRAQGHEVRVLHDPVAALTAMGEFRPDVAVLDIGLPVIDGYELAARLRQGLGDTRCRLIALTGYGREADRERSRQAGFEAHLVKPVNISQLLNLVADPLAAGAQPEHGPASASDRSSARQDL